MVFHLGAANLVRCERGRRTCRSNKRAKALVKRRPRFNCSENKIRPRSHRQADERTLSTMLYEDVQNWPHFASGCRLWQSVIMKEMHNLCNKPIAGVGCSALDGMRRSVWPSATMATHHRILFEFSCMLNLTNGGAASAIWLISPTQKTESY